MNKFYGQFNPPVDQFIFERYFPKKNIQGFFIECGAFDGLIESSCKFFEETMGWSGLNLEPAPSNYKTLQMNRSSSRNLQLGLSNQSGQVSFKHVISPILGTNFGNGSIAHTSHHLQSLKEGGCTFEEVQIDVITYKELIEREKIDYVDLLVLDVEGHELSVIEGMKNSLVLPDLICIEVGHLNFFEVRQHLALLGYTYDISSHVNSFFIKNEKLQLFALRRIDYIDNLLIENQRETAGNQKLEELQQDNQMLKGINLELQNLYAEMKGSKGWRFVELMRKSKKIIGI